MMSRSRAGVYHGIFILDTKLSSFGAICRLKKDHGIERGVPVLLSTEKPQCDLVSLGAIESGNPLDYQVGPLRYWQNRS